MVAKKRSDKSKKRSTSSAMGDVLNRQKKSSGAIEKMLEKNIVAEMSIGPAGKSKRKPLKDIAVQVAAKRRAKSAPIKAKAAVKSIKKSARVIKKVAKPTIEKKSNRPVLSKKPVSTKRPVTKKPVAKARHNKRASVEVITIGAGLFDLVGAGVGGLLSVGKTVTGFVTVGATKAVESVGSGAKSAKAKVVGAVKSVKQKAKANSEDKKSDNGAVAAAMKTATDVTGKMAGGVATVGSSVGKAAGYVVTGALAAPVDIVSGVIGVGASATSSVSRLLFGPAKPKRPKTEKQKKIPVV